MKTIFKRKREIEQKKKGETKKRQKHDLGGEGEAECGVQLNKEDTSKKTT